MLLDALVTLVEHGLDAAVACSGYHVVAYAQCSVAYKHRRHISAALVERRLDNAARSLAVRIGLEVEHLCLEKHLLQKVVNADALLGTYLLTLVLTAPLLYEQVHVGQVFAYLVRVGSRLVYLVYCKHHRNVAA